MSGTLSMVDSGSHCHLGSPTSKAGSVTGAGKDESGLPSLRWVEAEVSERCIANTFIWSMNICYIYLHIYIYMCVYIHIYVYCICILYICIMYIWRLYNMYDIRMYIYISMYAYMYIYTVYVCMYTTIEPIIWPI